jgi:hypothetical protein
LPVLEIVMAKLRVKVHPRPTLVIHRTAINEARLVYVGSVNKALKYRYGRSTIAYIGTTRRGVGRIAGSAAAKAPDMLRLHGVRELAFRVITCGKRQRVKTWAKLEHALLLTFREMYGDVPRCNTQGSKIRETDEFEYFTRARLRKILEEFER